MIRIEMDAKMVPGFRQIIVSPDRSRVQDLERVMLSLVVGVAL